MTTATLATTIFAALLFLTILAMAMRWPLVAGPLGVLTGLALAGLIGVKIIGEAS